nr:uncharacterized protein LOC129162115 isoform X2 [Nothobranchius furzeri]
MTSQTTTVRSQRVNNLRVRGFYSNKKINLPPAYTSDFIPANRAHIPTDKTAEAWSHLEHLKYDIAPLQDCEVGLLIGYNCSQAFLPREVVSGQDNEPFAQRTDLGWSIVGHGNPCVEYGDAIGIRYRIVVRQVKPKVDAALNLKGEVHYVNRSKVKEITPSDIINILETDFSEKINKDCVSQDDLNFLSNLKENITQKKDGHLEMPLPFKGERPRLPNNKMCTMHRLQCLERKLRKDKTYVNFMTDMIVRGDAEKIPEEEIWQNELPASKYKMEEVQDDDPELRRASVFNTKAKESRSLLERFEKFSDWSRLVKAVARLKRRVTEHKRLRQRTNEGTSLEEREDAEIAIVKLVQREAFPDEIKA